MNLDLTDVFRSLEGKEADFYLVETGNIYEGPNDSFYFKGTMAAVLKFAELYTEPRKTRALEAGYCAEIRNQDYLTITAETFEDRQE